MVKPEHNRSDTFEVKKWRESISKKVNELEETSSSILSFEQIQDNLSTFLTAGTGISLTYNDPSNTLAIASTGIDDVNSLTCTGLRTAYVAKTTTYTITTSDFTVNCDASGGAFTVTLPTAVGVSGKIYNVRKLDSSINAITIATTSAQTINGAATQSLSAQYQVITLQSDGANWMIL